MRPDWSKAPSWAMYASQELSGSYLYHEFKPVYIEICGEWRSTGRWAVVPKVTTTPQQTLEERPFPPEDWREVRDRFFHEYAKNRGVP